MLRRALVATLLVAGALLVPAAPAQAAPGLTATFSAANNGSWWLDISGWTLEFDLPSGVTMGNFYNGTATQSGSHVTIVNAHYNGTMAAGANTEPYSPWFIAYGSGTAPLNCRINGNKCDGSADRPPNAPSGLSVTGRTTKTVSLQWTVAVATDFPITSYDVYAGTTLKASTNTTSTTVIGLTPNTAYSFTVKAIDSRGNVSSASSAVSATTLNPADDTTPPTVPGSLRSTAKTAYSVSLATPADPAKIAAGWDIGANGVFRYMDFANVQGYDFHGAGSDNSWEPNRTGHQANLYRDTQDPYAFEFSVNKAIQTYLDAGVNPRQLTIGFPFYGRGWQGVTAGVGNGEWQSATGAAPGQFQEEAGTRGYANLIAMLPNCTIYHDTQSGSTYCFTGNGGQWWSFDDTWSIGQKTTWLKSKGLLGAMVWEMSGDTTSGTLMTTLHNGL